MTNDYSVRNEFSVYSAKQFLRSSMEQKLYAFVGRSVEWADEVDPPTPTSSEDWMIQSWDHMLLTKRINLSNMSLAAKKNIWQSGTIYQPWDSADGLIAEKKFFVITSQNRVYKCLDSIPNTPSTIEPDDTGITPVRLSDGYTWKFMYDISNSEYTKFNDTEVIPVKFIETDDGSLQFQVQKYAVPGTLNRIEVLDGGSGYSTSPEVVITGDGTGATATAVLDGDKVKYVIMTNPGSGYTWANVVFNGTSSVKATGRVILSPIKGHGSNPVDELFGSSVITTVTFDGNEAGVFPINIKFRQIGLLTNPTFWKSSTVADLSAASQQYTILNVGSLSGALVEGEYLNDTTLGLQNAARIIKIESNKVYVNNLKGDIAANDIMQGQLSGTSFEVINVIEPVLEPYSGNMLYVENRPPITKIENQSETYRLIIKF